MPGSRSLSHGSRRRFVVSLGLLGKPPPPFPPYQNPYPSLQSVCLVCQTATEKQLNASLPVKIGIKAKTMTQ